MSDTEYTVTQKDAADFLNVSTKSISRYRKRGLPYKLILNPLTGKQEVRFRYADLERWDQGRQLLATYPRDDGEPAGNASKAENSGERSIGSSGDHGFLAELMAAYKEQIELLRDQLEDMREQLGRRDRQIDDLMRLMVGLQLEYKPQRVESTTADITLPPEVREQPDSRNRNEFKELFETIPMPEPCRNPQIIEAVRPSASALNSGPAQKTFSREQISASILRLRRKGKGFDEIAQGLNRIGVATLSGQPEWTIPEVKGMLPSLVEMDAHSLASAGNF